MNYPAFTLCCLVAMLAPAGCGETAQASSQAPTAVVEVMSTATRSPEPSPTATPTVALSHYLHLLPRMLLCRRPDGVDTPSRMKNAASLWFPIDAANAWQLYIGFSLGYGLTGGALTAMSPLVYARYFGRRHIGAIQGRSYHYS